MSAKKGAMVISEQKPLDGIVQNRISEGTTLAVICSWFAILRVLLGMMLAGNNDYVAGILMFAWMYASVVVTLYKFPRFGLCVVIGNVGLLFVVKTLLHDETISMTVFAFSSVAFTMSFIQSIGTIFRTEWRFLDTCISTAILGFTWRLSGPGSLGEINDPMDGLFCYVGYMGVCMPVLAFSLYRLLYSVVIENPR